MKEKVLLSLILIAVFFLTACKSSVEQPIALEDPISEGISHEAEKAPELKLTTTEGKVINLADYQGQYVYLNFWNTDCAFCINELDELSVFAQAYGEEVAVLTVHVGDDVNLEKVMKANDFKLPVMVDLDGSAAENFMVEAYPSTYLIDKTGKIQGFIPEELTMEALEGSFVFLKEQSDGQK